MAGTPTPTPHDQVVDVTDEIHRLSGFAREAAEAAHEQGGTEGILEFYALLKDAVKVLSYIADTAGMVATEKVPDRFATYPIQSGGTFKVGGGKEKKRYDNERLIPVLAEAIRQHHGVEAVVNSDGERTDADLVVSEIVRTVAKATGAATPSFTGWRSTVAKELGVNLKDYAETEDTPLKPRIEGRSII